MVVHKVGSIEGLQMVLEYSNILVSIESWLFLRSNNFNNFKIYIDIVVLLASQGTSLFGGHELQACSVLYCWTNLGFYIFSDSSVRFFFQRKLQEIQHIMARPWIFRAWSSSSVFSWPREANPLDPGRHGAG